MKSNTLMLDSDLTANLADYTEGDSVQCLVTATVGPTDAKGSLTLEVTDIEPQTPKETPPAKETVLTKALKV